MGLVLPTGLRALVERHARQGRTGIAALRGAVLAWSLGDKPADSVLEPAMARLLAIHGLPPAEFHPIIEGLQVDFVIVGTPVVVECAGWEFRVTSGAEFAWIEHATQHCRRPATWSSASRGSTSSGGPGRRPAGSKR